MAYVGAQVPTVSIRANAHSAIVTPLVEAFRRFREAVEIRDPLFALLAQYWPPLARVRSEPEFVEILRGIGWDRPFKAPDGTPGVTNGAARM